MVAEQIIVLIALQAGLFDQVPLDKVPDGELALQKALAKLPKDIAARLMSEEKLSDSDHKAIVDLATGALASFQPKPDPGSPPKGSA
jgi:F-type H+-transporting ATPase subunit alpha